MAHAETDEAAGAPRGGSFPTDRVAPHPHPSWGAGGPRQRAAGRVSVAGGRGSGDDRRTRPPQAGRRPAILLEPDEVLRPVVAEAVRALGFEPGLAPAPVVFVNLAGLGVCPSLGGGSRPVEAHLCSRAGSIVARDGTGVVVGYVIGRPLTGAAHVLHGCCAQVLELRSGRDGPMLTTLLVPPGLAAAGPTAREADVLVLLLAGATDRAAAAALGVAPSTVRSHARSVLRKAGITDRRSLRRLDARPPATSFDAMSALL